MSLVNFVNVDYSVGGPLLLDGIDFAIERNERICVVGRNGAGKSTLLRLIDGQLRPDDGEVRVESGVRIARLAQEVPRELSGSVFDVVATGLGDLGTWLAEFHRLSQHLDVPGNTDKLANVHTRIDEADGWNLDRRVERTLSRLDLPEDTLFSALSGGMKRRVLLARALVAEPDVLLLDEPTNHLDIEAIDWLEKLLLEYPGSIVFVTHDRRFLRALATRIVEIDRGRVTSWPGDYANYLRRREERAHAEAQANALFDRKLAEEEIWIRQGIKARRTRNEGRVRDLEAMRMERAERRSADGTVRMRGATGSSSGRRVIEAEDVVFAFGTQPIIRDFSTLIQRGDRVGLIGPNGSGKTTLLRLLLGQLTPQSGQIRIGTRLDIAYFDQHRSQLREDQSALDNVSDGAEFIEIDGARKHALGYLQDFLFSPERARAPITALSGGERNRLLLAKLFAKSSNLLVMDEPTNDLDVETLELLEELLAAYRGTLLLVSHDREFLDNVVTSTLVLEGNGKVGEYVGGYSDWLRQRPQPPTIASEPSNAGAGAMGESKSLSSRTSKSAKLGFNQKRELEKLPKKIEELEARIATLGKRIQDPAFYRQDSSTIADTNSELADTQAKLDAAYERWAELEDS